LTLECVYPGEDFGNVSYPNFCPVFLVVHALVRGAEVFRSNFLYGVCDFLNCLVRFREVFPVSDSGNQASGAAFEVFVDMQSVVFFCLFCLAVLSGFSFLVGAGAGVSLGRLWFGGLCKPLDGLW
jgi:hypothetical protein